MSLSFLLVYNPEVASATPQPKQASLQTLRASEPGLPASLLRSGAPWCLPQAH